MLRQPAIRQFSVKAPILAGCNLPRGAVNSRQRWGSGLPSGWQEQLPRHEPLEFIGNTPRGVGALDLCQLELAGGHIDDGKAEVFARPPQPHQEIVFFADQSRWVDDSAGCHHAHHIPLH
jgi:hypothetical protein